MIAYANCIRSIQLQIIEAHRVLKGIEPNIAFKTALQDTTVDCSKEGLLPEIYLRLSGSSGTMDQIVEKAIKIETKLQAQSSRNKMSMCEALLYLLVKIKL